MHNEFAKCEIKTSVFSGRKSRTGNYWWRIHFHRYWTGMRFRFVEISEVSAPLNAPVGLPILCHKSLFDNDKHPRRRPCSDGSQSFSSLSLGSTGSKHEGARMGHLLCSTE